MFCAINSKDVLLHRSIGLIKKCQKGHTSAHTVEKIAHRFNQVMKSLFIYFIALGARRSVLVDFNRRSNAVDFCSNRGYRIKTRICKIFFRIFKITFVRGTCPNERAFLEPSSLKSAYFH